jgi:predicted DNA binding CopG/RHH family protein
MDIIDDNIMHMRKKLPPQERLSQLVGLRMRPEEHRMLKKEAEAHGLDLQNYVRMLVKTHPSRKAGK